MCSAVEAQKIRATRTGIVIAVRDPGASRIPLKAGWRDILALEVPDVDASGVADPAWNLDESARRIARFVGTNATATRILLHCHLGVSRSRSIAAALCVHRGWPYAWTVLHQPLYDAVLRALRLEGWAEGASDCSPRNGD